MGVAVGGDEVAKANAALADAADGDEVANAAIFGVCMRNILIGSSASIFTLSIYNTRIYYPYTKLPCRGNNYIISPVMPTHPAYSDMTTAVCGI